MRYPMIALALGCAAAATSPAAARRAVVTIDARAMPWDPGLNPKRAFGVGDGQRPVYVWGLDLVPESRLLFTATGIVNVLPDAPRPPAGGQGFRSADQVPDGPAGSFPGFPRSGATPGVPGMAGAPVVPVAPGPTVGTGPIAQAGTWGPAGQPFRPANGSIGALGTVFPSYYMPTKSYPVRVNALLGAFVNADGAVVGDPFLIGDRVIATVPKGAAAIALGINAESFAYNRGVIKIIIDTRTPTVTVEEARPPAAIP